VLKLSVSWTSAALCIALALLSSIGTGGAASWLGLRSYPIEEEWFE
jgi:hypothetical protein